MGVLYDLVFADVYKKVLKTFQIHALFFGGGCLSWGWGVTVTNSCFLGVVIKKNHIFFNLQKNGEKNKFMLYVHYICCTYT